MGQRRTRSIATALLLLSCSLKDCDASSRVPLSSSKPAPILLFAGVGTSPSDVAALEALLAHSHLLYSTADSSQLNAMSRAELAAYRLLLIPGGDFIAMGDALTSATHANLHDAVQDGAGYLGICAGAFLAGKFRGGGFDLASGAKFNFYAAESRSIRKAVVAISSPGSAPLEQYWQDGPELSGWGAVAARYPDGTPAVVEGHSGRGWVLLSGVHPEAPRSWRHGMTFHTLQKMALNSCARPGHGLPTARSRRQSYVSSIHGCFRAGCSASLLFERRRLERDRHDRPFPEASALELQQTLDDVVAAKVSPGVAVLVKRPGYVAWSAAAGVADLESGAALSPTARFRAGSILKIAVATATLQLVERNQLSLEARLPELLPPELTNRLTNADRITLRMLLNHTSGVAEFDDAEFDLGVVADPLRVWSPDEFLDRAFSQPPTATPGAAYHYSNTEYVLLGKILEQASGLPWRALVNDRVFARAQLTHTTLPAPGDPSCGGCARGYLPVDESLLDLTEADPSMADAAGGEAMITTTADVAKLLGALAAGELFDDAATLGQMTEFREAPVPEEAQSGYGLGLARFQLGDVELFGHLGGTAGFQSFDFYQPSTGVVVSGYMNCNGDFGGFVTPVLDAVGRALSTSAP